MRILIVGPGGSHLAAAVADVLAEEGSAKRMVLCDTVEQALDTVRRDSAFELLFCDAALDIHQLTHALAAERITLPLIACGVDVDAAAAVRAIKAGAQEFLPLPPDRTLIGAILRTVSRDRREVIGQDPRMAATLLRARQVAKSDATVLITGATGTGKEVLARGIHAASRHAGGPFIAVNCAAIPEALLESELFGHEKGAFSGALARRIGKFELANDGTLLLDEISEMDVRLQAKLLRAIQEREIDRVGGGHAIRVTARIIATSNRDLRAEISRGTFREDLFFRLNVITLTLPSLAERPADIAPLASHFARHFAELNGFAPKPLTPAAIARLERHGWPGNVRELENVIHRAVLLSEGDTLDSVEFSGERPAPVATASFVGRSIDDVERDLILRTLEHTLGNRTHAAMILGISIRALRNKLRDYLSQGCEVRAPKAA